MKRIVPAPWGTQGKKNGCPYPLAREIRRVWLAPKPKAQQVSAAGEGRKKEEGRKGVRKEGRLRSIMCLSYAKHIDICYR